MYTYKIRRSQLRWTESRVAFLRRGPQESAIARYVRRTDSIARCHAEIMLHDVLSLGICLQQCYTYVMNGYVNYFVVIPPTTNQPLSGEDLPEIAAQPVRFRPIGGISKGHVMLTGPRITPHCITSCEPKRLLTVDGCCHLMRSDGSKQIGRFVAYMSVLCRTQFLLTPLMLPVFLNSTMETAACVEPPAACFVWLTCWHHTRRFMSAARPAPLPPPLPPDLPPLPLPPLPPSSSPG